MKMREIKIIFSIAVLLIMTLLNKRVESAEIIYPLKEIERPLTIYKGLLELTIGDKYIKHSGRGFHEVIFSGRYGLTDNIELSSSGINYSFRKNSIDILIGGGPTSVGYSSISGYIINYQAQTKLRLIPKENFAILINVVDKHRSGSFETNSIRLSTGGLIQLTSNLALTILGGYGKFLTRYGSDNLNINANLHINLNQRFDLNIFSNFNSVEEEKVFREITLFEENRKQLFGIGVNIRF